MYQNLFQVKKLKKFDFAEENFYLLSDFDRVFGFFSLRAFSSMSTLFLYDL